MVEIKMFAQGVAQEISNYLPEQLQDVTCTVTERQKNNGVSLVGINFQAPDCALTPILYMEPFYEEIRNGRPTEQVYTEIANHATEAIQSKEIVQGISFGDYDSIKEHLRTLLINTKANQKRLSTMPHKEMEDLSLVFAIRVPTPETDGRATIQITNELLNYWGVNEETLYQDALEQTQKKEPPVFQHMRESIMVQMGMDSGRNTNLFDSEGCFQRDSSQEMYVLTNTEKVNGASTLAYPGVLEKIDTLFPEGFYILPSSVHECLCLPRNALFEPKQLGQMVRDVNREQLQREDVLSDRVYEYDKSVGKLCQVPESIAKERGMER